jgi:hypothetical protein
MAVLAALSVAGAAAAQTGFSARIGVFFRSSDSTGFTFGGDYRLQSVSIDNQGQYPSYLGVSADYYSRGGAGWNLPIALTYNVRVQQLLFSAGAGLDLYRLDGDTKTGFGGQIGVNYDFASSNIGNPVYVGAKYFLASDADRSGLALYVGYRF